MTITKKIANIKSLLAAIRVEIKERDKNLFSDREEGESFLDDYTTRELRAKIEELTHRKNMLELVPPTMRRVLNY